MPIRARWWRLRRQVIGWWRDRYSAGSTIVTVWLHVRRVIVPRRPWWKLSKVNRKETNAE